MHGRYNCAFCCWLQNSNSSSLGTMTFDSLMFSGAEDNLSDNDCQKKGGTRFPDTCVIMV